MPFDQRRHIQTNDLAILHAHCAVDHAQIHLRRGAEDQRGQRIVQRAGEVEPLQHQADHRGAPCPPRGIRRAADEALKPLAAYRTEELERMRLNFFGFDPSYHVARYNFVRKVPKSRTPLYLARHRARRPDGERAQA